LLLKDGERQVTSPHPNDPVYDTEPDAVDWEPLSDDDEVRAMADYLADMIGQLENMARRSRLDLLVYLLSMAKAEAQACATPRRDA
jgi:hypothetical protein